MCYTIVLVAILRPYEVLDKNLHFIYRRTKMNQPNIMLTVFILSLCTAVYADDTLPQNTIELEEAKPSIILEGNIAQLIHKQNLGETLTELEKAIVKLDFEEQKSKELDRSIAQVEQRISDIQQRIDAGLALLEE